MQNVSKLAAVKTGWVTLSQDFRGKGSSPCQYIDTTRNAIDYATTLPLTVFIQWNFAADFSSCIVEIVQKSTNLCNYPHFEEVRGGIESWLMARWKAGVRLSIRHNWTFFASSYRSGATRQNVSRLAAIRKG